MGEGGCAWVREGVCMGEREDASKSRCLWR